MSDLLVEQAHDGSEAAFDELVSPHRRELHVHCYRMLGSVEDAEDAVQETMLRAWSRLSTYAGTSTFRAWLYGIVTNTCLDALRRRKRRVWPTEVAGPRIHSSRRRRRLTRRGSSLIPMPCWRWRRLNLPRSQWSPRKASSSRSSRPSSTCRPGSVRS